MFSISSLTEMTPTHSKKPAIIKSMILKNEQKKKYVIQGGKENIGASINYDRKFKKTFLGLLQ